MIFIIVPVFSVIIFVTLLTAIIKSVNKTMSKLENNDTENTIAENFKKAFAEAKEQQNPHTTCDYCGTTYEKKEKKCPSCGAKLTKK